jgi:hypothetical protein
VKFICLLFPAPLIRSIVKKSMAVLLTTSGGVYLWNLKELVPRKKFVSTGGDGVLCSAVSPNGIPAIT